LDLSTASHDPVDATAYKYSEGEVKKRGVREEGRNTERVLRPREK
jgi:hypothetical protein